MSAASAMNAALAARTPGCREIQLSSYDRGTLSPALPKVFALICRIPPNRHRGLSNRSPVREFRPPISFVCSAFVPPREGPSDRGHSTTKTFTHGEKLTQYSTGKGTKHMTYFKNFINDEEGQDLVEYALLLGFIAILAVTAVTTLGTKVNSYFTIIGSKLT